jgi:NADPH:quinone reductase
MHGFITDPRFPSGVRMADDLPEPVPQAHELLLDVRAYAINPGELILIERRPDGWRPGQDVAGVVARAAADGSGPPEGTRIVAVVDWEGWAERVAVPTHRMAALDPRVPVEQASTLPVAGLTALRALRVGGALLGRRVLITGATGGVGQFAVQLAVASGARVTAQVSGPDRVDEARRLGAHDVVISLDGDGPGPFDLVLDGVGGPDLARAVRRLRPGATALTYGSRGGTTELSLKDFFYSGAWNARVMGFVSELPLETRGEDIGILAALVAEGRLVPQVGRVEDWARTPDVLAALAERQIRGKAVLTRGPVERVSGGWRGPAPT